MLDNSSSIFTISQQIFNLDCTFLNPPNMWDYLDLAKHCFLFFEVLHEKLDDLGLGIFQLLPKSGFALYRYALFLVLASRTELHPFWILFFYHNAHATRCTGDHALHRLNSISIHVFCFVFCDLLKLSLC